MLHQEAQAVGGNMSDDLREKVVRLLDEFVAAVEEVSEERHLQKGIARSLLPSSMAAIVDQQSLFIIAEFKPENRSAFYIYNPDMDFTPLKVMNSAVWEFGFENPFLVEFPKGLLDMAPEDRKAEVMRIAAEHVDSEFLRFMSFLSLLRTRPIFGSAPLETRARFAYLLLPPGEGEVYEALAGAVEDCDLTFEGSEDIREGKAAVREMWFSINQSRVIVADLTGADPGVMYGLGIAHTLGKETVLIYPRGSKYLTDIPRAQKIEYDETQKGRADVRGRLSEILRSIIQPIT